MRGLILIAALPACIFSPPPALEDDDGPTAVTVGFAIDAQTVAEAAGTVPVMVSLSASTDVTVTVMVGIGTGSAMQGQDFNATATTLTFGPGQTSKTIDVTIVDDGANGEPDETVVLALSAVTGADLGIDTHTITITEAQPVCIGTGVYMVCPVVTPTAPVTLPATLDTTNDPLCAAVQPIGWIAAGQPESCVVTGTTITVTNTLVTGSRPLVLAATDRIDIATLDFAAHRDSNARAPGSPSLSCVAPTQAPGNSANGAPGGAGATFRNKGGNGGDGGGNNTEGKSANPPAAPTVLQAGCDGQAGGTGDGAAGNPGRGGGALYVVATNSITITTLINGSGAGASASTNTKAGGSGGGSGGMVKLSAPAITATGATIMVNGGGGASGAGTNDAGNPGEDPNALMPLVPAPGGLPGTAPGGSNGGSGFATGAGATAAPNTAANDTGGGGGGGAGGFIQTSIALTGATTSGQVNVAP